MRENRTLVGSLAIVTGAVLAGSSALIGIGVAFKAAAAGIAVFRIALTVLSRHPYLIALTILLGIIAAIATYFWSASDGADAFNESLDKADTSLSDSSTLTTARGNEAAALRQQALAMQASLDSQISQTMTLDQAALQGIEQVLGQSMEATARFTERTAIGVERMVQLMLSGRGGLVGGVG